MLRFERAVCSEPVVASTHSSKNVYINAVSVTFYFVQGIQWSGGPLVLFMPTTRTTGVIKLLSTATLYLIAYTKFLPFLPPLPFLSPPPPPFLPPSGGQGVPQQGSAPCAISCAA